MVRFLVAYDGSDEAKLALKRAVEDALLKKAEMTILEVIEVGPGRYKMYGDPIHEAKKEAKKALKALEKLKEQLDVPELNIEVKVRIGHPVEEILKEAEESSVDTIYMGSKGLSGLPRMLLGSVAEGVTRHASTSVVVIRAEK
ncbi:MAG: universal stress protein [Methermicoccaceae archaeon]